MVKLLTEIVSPEVNEVLEKFRSEPDVPTLPWMIRVVLEAAWQFVVLLVVQMRKCAAVPVALADSDVIALNVRTPAETVPAVEDSGRDARTVPESTVATLAGCAPETIIR